MSTFYSYCCTYSNDGPDSLEVGMEFGKPWFAWVKMFTITSVFHLDVGDPFDYFFEATVVGGESIDFSNSYSQDNGGSPPFDNLTTYISDIRIAGVIEDEGTPLSGVSILGVSSTNGKYLATKTRPFTGVAEPVKTGFVFIPETVSYNSLTKYTVDDYEGTTPPVIRSVKLGANGAFIVVAAKDGVYLSTDSGANWTRKTPDAVEDTDWVKGICSSDGTYIVVVSSDNAIYRSANSGTAWAAITPAGGDTFSVNKMATSDDGQFMVIVGQNSTDATESCYISTNYGAAWTAKKPVAASIEYTECDISNDGAIIAVSTTSNFYISFDSGTTWMEQGMASTAEVWEGLSISGDGAVGLITNTNNNDEFFIGTYTELYSEATWVESVLTSAGRAILDDIDAPAQATTLGLGIGDSPQFTGLEIGHVSDTTLTRASAGDINVEGKLIYRADGTDVPVVDGGTGQSSLTDHGILLGSGSSAITPLGVASNGQLPIGSTGADPILATLTGTANQITVANAAGSITLSLPQNIHTGASPTFTGLTVDHIGEKTASHNVVFDNDIDTQSINALEIITNGGVFAGTFSQFSTFLRGNGIGTYCDLGSNAANSPSMRIAHSQGSPGTDVSTLIQFRDFTATNLYGTSIVHAGETNPTIDGTSFTLTANTLNFLRHDNSAAGAVMLSLSVATGNALFSGIVQAEQLTSTDDITMQGHLLTMGNNSSADDIVLSFLSSGNDATITYDQTDDEFDFGDARITTTGAFTGNDLYLNNLYHINDSDTGLIFGDDSFYFICGEEERAYFAKGNVFEPIGIHFNRNGDDVDTAIEGDTDQELFYVDAGNDRVGISTSTPAVLFDVVGVSRFGDSSTNYTEITSTGDIKPTGSADIVIKKASGNGIKIDHAAKTFGWRDLKGKITNSKGSTKPTEVTYRDGITQFQFSAGDDAGLEYHVPHDYVLGTDIHLHVHWSHNSGAVTGGNIILTYEITYCKGHNQAAFPATVTGTITGTASATQYKHIISEEQISATSPEAGVQIDTDDLEPDGLILCRIEMTTNNMTGATPSPFIHEVDVHYQSSNIATKQKAPDFYT